MAKLQPIPPNNYPTQYPNIVPAPGQINVPIADPRDPKAAEPKTPAIVDQPEFFSLRS